VFPSPQGPPPNSNIGSSGHLYASNSDDAPPAYHNGEEMYQPTSTPPFPDEKGGLAPEQSRAVQPESSGSSSGSSYPYAIPASPPSAQSGPFARQVPQQHYPPFNPTFLIATGQYLTRGFPALPPPSNVNPHPFVTHDVTEDEWLM
jgi:hypothetical protein